MKSKIINIVIALSLVSAAFFAAMIPTNWFSFAVSSIVMFSAILFQRKEQKILFNNTNSSQFTLGDFNKALFKIKEKLDEYNSKSDDNFLEKIENDLEDILPDIENYRLGIIEQVGVEKYTELITTYAIAERLINRGVSAAIDKYSNAAKEYFGSALPAVEKTIEIINKIKT